MKKYDVTVRVEGKPDARFTVAASSPTLARASGMNAFLQTHKLGKDGVILGLDVAETQLAPKAAEASQLPALGAKSPEGSSPGKLRIELKRVQFSERMSEETNCFVADVWVDGVKAGTAQNHGTGGNTDIHPRELLAKLDAYAATLPPHTYGEGADAHSFQQTGEGLIDEALSDYLETKRLRRLCSKKTLFRRPGKEYDEEAGAWDYFAVKFTPEFKAKVLVKYPGAVFANELPEMVG